VQKENANVKRTCGKKIGNLNEHHIVAIEEHTRVFLFDLACKKKWIVHSRRRSINTLGAFSYMTS
jgi:hypothetical protein